MHILCGIDEPASGQATANVAALVAHRMGADLTLVHLITMPAASARKASATPPVTNEGTSARVLSAERELDALADDVAAAFGARPEVRVVLGDNPATELRAAVWELAGDLIVIGAAPRRRFASVLSGGTREALVQIADCPVMVVPSGAAPPTGDGVAVAYETGASAGAATVAARLASRLEGTLTVIHVLADPPSYAHPVLPMYHEARDVVEAAVDGDDLDLRHFSAYRLPAAHLAHVVGEVQPDLLVVAAPRRRKWTNLVRPSVGALLLRRATCPVVLVPDGAAVLATKPTLVSSA